MRIVFDESGAMREFHVVTPVEPGPAAPWVTIDVEYPAYLVEGIRRAAAAHRWTYAGGKVCLDGSPWTPPATRAEVTYGQALAGIAAASTVAQLRNILYRVADQFLETGALEL